MAKSSSFYKFAFVLSWLVVVLSLHVTAEIDCDQMSVCEETKKARRTPLYILYGLCGFELFIIIAAVIAFAVAVSKNRLARKKKDTQKRDTAEPEGKV